MNLASTAAGSSDGERSSRITCLIGPIAPVPVFRIDRGMAESAVRQARRLGVLATLPTTLNPTVSLLREAAAEAGADCRITERLCEGAFAKLRAGDKAGHNAAVRAGFSALASSVDVVVLAQASMADAIEGTDQSAPFLTSPEIGMLDIAKRLQAS